MRAAGAAAGRLLTRDRLARALPFALFALMLAYLGIQAPNFLSPSTIGLILKQAVPTVIVCLGLAAVVMAGGDDIVSGGIDISVPATTVLCAAIVADQISNHGSPLGVALALAFAAAMAVGWLNAALVALIGMTPLLATLASSVAAVGATKVITASRRINVDHPAINFIRDGDLFGIPAGVLLALAIFAVYHHFCHRSQWGMHLQAVGGGAGAAEISGINSRRILVQSFLVAALAGWLASVFVLARGSGSSPGTEENLLLEMVLATFLGAVFSPRRVVTIWGAALGAVLVAGLTVGFKSVGLNVFWTGCIKGALILVVVASSAVAGKPR